ncbi:MAG TPA: GNAT family N-acetyltransferase [Anaerolineales bacterium]
MSAISYRPATESDFAALVAMYEKLNTFFYEVGYLLPRPEKVGELWLDSFRRTLGRFSNVIIAEREGRPLGFILCRLKRLPAHMGGLLVGEVSDVWVEGEARRASVGEALVQAGVEWLRQQGVHSVEVQVLSENQASMKFFESLGFKLELRALRLILEKDAQQAARFE